MQEKPKNIIFIFIVFDIFWLINSQITDIERIIIPQKGFVFVLTTL